MKLNYGLKNLLQFQLWGIVLYVGLKQNGILKNGINSYVLIGEGLT